MSILDTLMLLCALLAAVLVITRGIAVRGVAVALALICLTQWLAEGYYWQCIPAYGLLCVAGVSPGVALTQSGVMRIAVRVVAGMALLLLMLCWVFVPVPRLPVPTGPHAVGSSVFRWLDSARTEPATSSDDDRRDVIVQAWYPALAPAVGRRAQYIDGLGRLPGRVAGIPRAVLTHYDRVDPHATSNAAMESGAALWPVVVFSPGYGASRSFYTALLSDLASRGFIVLAVDHPYEAAIAQLADGRLVTPIERFLPNEPNRIPYMIRQSTVRVADLQAVVNEIGSTRRFGLLASHMDRNRIFAVGHSFGGAASVAVAATDARLQAAVNIDGTPYGSIPDHMLAQPFLLIESDHADTPHGQRFVDGNARIFAMLRGAGYRYQIEHANHYSFTDASLLLSLPVRWVASLVLGGARGTAETVRLTNDLLVAFLTGSRESAGAQLRVVESRYTGLRRIAVGGGR
jgi:dienelactone hydrolase